jgi:hypothetical protein
MSDTNITPEVNNEEEVIKTKFETLLLAYVDANLNEFSRRPLENRAVYLKIQEIYNSISDLASKIDMFDDTLGDKYEDLATNREEELKAKIIEYVKTNYYDVLVDSITNEVDTAKVREDILEGRIEELEKDIIISCGNSKF